MNRRASSQFYLKGNVVFSHFCGQLYPPIKTNWILSSSRIQMLSFEALSIAFGDLSEGIRLFPLKSQPHPIHHCHIAFSDPPLCSSPPPLCSLSAVLLISTRFSNLVFSKLDLSFSISPVHRRASA